MQFQKNFGNRVIFEKYHDFQIKFVAIKILNFLIEFLYFDSKGILVKNRNFGQRLKFCSKIEILVKDWNFVQKSKLWLEIEFWLKIELFMSPFFVSKFVYLEILVKSENSEVLFTSFGKCFLESFDFRKKYSKFGLRPFLRILKIFFG